MTTIAIPLTEERMAQLRLRAEQAGLAPEEFLRHRVEQLLDQPDDQFRRAAAYVLEKNAELYRRLGMIRYLTLEEVLELHRLGLARSGGLAGVRDLGGLDSALAQPRMTFGGQDLYPNLAEKAAALGLSLVCNHPFVDGNKRVGHAAMETFLVLNGWELAAGVDEQEQVILQLAAGTLKRDAFTAWVQAHLRQRPAEPGAAADRPRE